MSTIQLGGPAAARQFRIGLLFAISSALAFGSSGPFAKALMEAGWSPIAAATARLAGGAVAMVVFAGIAHPGWFREALRHSRTVILYGLVPIAGAQLFYYNAVAHLSVGVALLLEYTAPILVAGWVWARTRHRPSRMTFAGVGLAVTGIMLVLNVFTGAHINLVGVGWGLAAAVCAACYFMMSDRVSAEGTGLNPISLATGGLIVGAAAVALLAATGVMPMTFTAAPVAIAGFTTSWLVPVIALGLIPTAIAYTLGILGIARLKPRFASLVGLSEVMFAILSAWILLGEAITLAQAVGGAVVLFGLALARQGETDELESRKINDACWPDAAVQNASSE